MRGKDIKRKRFGGNSNEQKKREDMGVQKGAQGSFVIPL